MARLLLDTCAIIWIALDAPIEPRAKQALRDAWQAGRGVSVSPISAWELGLLSAKGKLPTAQSPAALFGEVLATKASGSSH